MPTSLLSVVEVHALGAQTALAHRPAMSALPPRQSPIFHILCTFISQKFPHPILHLDS